MTTERFSNQASTTLATSVGSGDLSISVQVTTHFPNQPEFRIRIGQELMLVTGISGTTWTVLRGVEGTTDSSHAAGSVVIGVLTAGGIDELRTEIEAEIPQNTVQTSDSRLSNDRTASGIRTATTVVSVSSAAAPTPGQVLTATSGTAADWETPSGASLATTFIAAGSGPVSITTVVGSNPGLPFPVPPSTVVRAEVDLMCSAAGQKFLTGTLVCTAHRIGSASLIVTSQSLGIPLEVTDITWNPIWVANGNSLELQISGDPLYKFNVRGHVRIYTTDVSADDQTPDGLLVARAAILADSPEQLYYADTLGLADGALVPTWPDASGASRNLSFAAGHQGTYSSALKGVTCTTALAVTGVAAGAAGATSDFTLRWTMTLSSASGAGELLFLCPGTNQYVGIHCATGFNSAGSNVGYSQAAPGGGPVGLCVVGKHNYELRVSRTNSTVILYVDGVAGSLVTGVAQAILTNPWGIGFGSYYLNCVLHGWCVQASVGDDTQMQHWLTMSGIAW